MVFVTDWIRFGIGVLRFRLGRLEDVPVFKTQYLRHHIRRNLQKGIEPSLARRAAVASTEYVSEQFGWPAYFQTRKKPANRSRPRKLGRWLWTLVGAAKRLDWLLERLGDLMEWLFARRWCAQGLGRTRG